MIMLNKDEVDAIRECLNDISKKLNKIERVLNEESHLDGRFDSDSYKPYQKMNTQLDLRAKHAETSIEKAIREYKEAVSVYEKGRPIHQKSKADQDNVE